MVKYTSYTWWKLNNSDFFFAELLVERLRTGYTKDVKNNQTENKTPNEGRLINIPQRTWPKLYVSRFAIITQKKSQNQPK